MVNIYTPGEQITSVCTNYQELLHSDDFNRILNIVFKRISLFQPEVILGYFEKIKTGKELSEEEKINLISFAKNKNVEESFKGLLGKFKNPLDTQANDVDKQESFSAFLKEIFGENGFEKTRESILLEAGIDTNKQVVNILSHNLDKWGETMGERFAGIKKFVEIKGDNIIMKIPNYGNLTFTGNRSDLSLESWGLNGIKSTFSKIDIEKLILLFGGKKSSRVCFSDNEILVGFFKNVLGLRNGSYWLNTESGHISACCLNISDNQISLSVGDQNIKRFTL